MSRLQHNWYTENKGDILIEYKERRKNDAAFRAAENHRAGLRVLIHGKKKSKYVNCSGDRFRDWISFQFSQDMTFDNYGNFWTCDHVIPIHKYLSGELSEDVVFDWLNVQPITKKDNLRKNKHVTLEECKNHLQKVKLYLEIRKLEPHSSYIEKLESFCNNFAKHLDAGNTSELHVRSDTPECNSDSSDTTSDLKGSEGTRLIAEPNGNNSGEGPLKGKSELVFIFIEDDEVEVNPQART